MDFFTRETAHHKIYVDFISRLSSGEYNAGERLPSCQKVADEYKVAKGTVYKAYKLLADSGLIRSDHRGTYVADISEISPHTSLAKMLIDTIEHAKQSGITERNITDAIELLMERYC